MADLEQLILSGDFFRARSRPTSPERSPSPDGAATWGADGIIDDADADAAAAKNAQIEHMLGQPLPDNEEGGVGVGVPGRTGVKGVIRDRDEAAARARARRTADAAALARQMERAALSARTYAQDAAAERTTAEDGGAQARADVWGRAKGRFGHLREVGVKGFVGAVEGEERGVWVVVHLYDAALDRCDALDDTLARLARQHAHTKFLRARAAALGFASASRSFLSAAPPAGAHVRRPARRMPGHADDDDPYGDGHDDEDDEDGEGSEGEDGEGDTDTDMLPTVLVYRDGELVFNWVRVDWEAGTAGVEDLLVRHHVLERAMPLGGGDLGLLDDDELFASDED